MAVVATAKQLRANYQNNGEKADRIAINAVMIGEGLPRAIVNLERMPDYERKSLAAALRTMADLVDQGEEQEK